MDLARHVKGREAFGALLDGWINASTLTPNKWVRLGEKCLGVSKLNAAQLSGVRTGISTQIGVAMFDALAAINRVAWLCHRKQQTVLTGPLADKIPLIPPLEIEGGPADAADFVMIYLGEQEPPALPEDWMGAKVVQSAPVDMGKAAGRAIRQAITRKGFTDPLDGFAAFISEYPTGDKDRLGRLREVCFGLSEFTPAELDRELVAICIALKGFTGEGWTQRRIAESAVRSGMP
jgi:hypothetical protein